MERQLITAATIPVLTQSELEAHCRTLGATNADVLPYLLAAAEHIERNICDRAFTTQTWRVYLDCWPCGDIVLPLGWLQSVTHIKYYDTTDTPTTIATSEYAVSTGGDLKGRIRLKYGKSWPTAMLRTLNPIEVEFVCGKTSADLIPQTIRQAVRLLAASWYENREEVVIGNAAAIASSKLAEGMDSLLVNWRLH